MDAITGGLKMSSQTPYWGIPYPSGTDHADPGADFGRMAISIDASAQRMGSNVSEAVSNSTTAVSTASAANETAVAASLLAQGVSADVSRILRWTHIENILQPSGNFFDKNYFGSAYFNPAIGIYSLYISALSSQTVLRNTTIVFDARLNSMPIPKKAVSTASCVTLSDNVTSIKGGANAVIKTDGTIVVNQLPWPTDFTVYRVEIDFTIIINPATWVYPT